MNGNGIIHIETLMFEKESNILKTLRIVDTMFSSKNWSRKCLVNSLKNRLVLCAVTNLNISLNIEFMTENQVILWPKRFNAQKEWIFFSLVNWCSFQIDAFQIFYNNNSNTK